MRINITMNEELVKMVDEVAKKMYVSRSAYIAFAVSQKIQADKMLDNMPELVQTMKAAVELEKAKRIDGQAPGTGVAAITGNGGGGGGEGET